MESFNEDLELIKLFNNGMIFVIQNPITEFEESELTIDELLDKYNDYMTLYNMFGDQSYLNAAEKIMMELRGK